MTQEAVSTATEQVEVAHRPSAGSSGVLWVHPQVLFTPFGDQVTIGRVGSGSVWELASNDVSRAHAELTKSGPHWLLTDLSSKNGTWVNGTRVRSSTLFEQDVLRLGECVGVVTHLKGGATDPFVQITSTFRVGPAMTDVATSIATLARSDIPIVVCGETGTGKEVAARAIHELSGRSGTFVAVNCATIPESMAEAQLFGYRRGAFTGAAHDTDGLFASAERGTLLLDEIGDLSAPVQAKLLRVIEEGAFTPLGTSKPQRSSVRLLAACQENLQTLVARGTFRGDLFARLSGAELALLPLRARKEDVLYLLSSFLHERGVTAKPTTHFVERLLCYDYPYNVRELLQLARLLANHNPERLQVNHLPQRFHVSAEGSENPPAPPLDEAAPAQPTTLLKGRRAAWLIQHARELATLESVLKGNGWNVSDAARELGIPRHRALRLLAASKAFQA